MLVAIYVMDNEENANGRRVVLEPGVRWNECDMYEASVTVKLCTDQAEVEAFFLEEEKSPYGEDW